MHTGMRARSVKSGDWSHLKTIIRNDEKKKKSQAVSSFISFVYMGGPTVLICSSGMFSDRVPTDINGVDHIFTKF